MRPKRKTIRFRGREEAILDIFRIRGRTYFALEELSRRGAYRVFDPHAGTRGDYRVLYRLSAEAISQQRLEILNRLGGPTANRNFPTIVECTRSGRDYFVVMTWVWGVDLRSLLANVKQGEKPRPSVPEVVRLFRGLAHGVSHYHRRANLVHGDISPANILATSRTSQLVLVDFGSAWPVEMSAKKAAGDGYTNVYAAPERIAKHATEDFRSDLFSLAVVAYELLTLGVPYDNLGGQAGLPTLLNKTADSLIYPSALVDGASRYPRDSIRSLDALFKKSLALHPDGRYGTRSEWLQAWDGVHSLFQKGSRLGRFERLIVGGIDRAIRFLPRK